LFFHFLHAPVLFPVARLIGRLILLKPQDYCLAAIHFRNDFTPILYFHLEMNMDKKQELRLVARKLRAQEKEMKKKKEKIPY
jgi:hypothetical protein